MRTHTPTMIQARSPRLAGLFGTPGIYFARLPFLPHMDLRVEAVSSEGLPIDFGGQHFFINNQYLDGNTNKGFMLGNAVGRDGRAIEGVTSYWLSARTEFRQATAKTKVALSSYPVARRLQTVL